MWMFFKREVMFFELPGAGGNDIFWAPRTVYFNLYAFCGASDINNFWKCLQYFIWMCFWFLYRNGSRSRSLNPSSLISLTLSLSLSDLSLSLSLTLSLSPSNSISFFLYLCFSSIFFFPSFPLFSFVLFSLSLSLSLFLSLRFSISFDSKKIFFLGSFFHFCSFNDFSFLKHFALCATLFFFLFFSQFSVWIFAKLKFAFCQAGGERNPRWKKGGFWFLISAFSVTAAGRASLSLFLSTPRVLFCILYHFPRQVFRFSLSLSLSLLFCLSDMFPYFHPLSARPANHDVTDNEPK